MNATILRALRGAPLSVLVALWLHGPAGREELVTLTGYSINAISQAVAYLEREQAIQRLHYRAWSLNPGWSQLPLPTAEPHTNALISAPASRSAVDNPVDNFLTVSADSAERSLSDLSATPAPPPPITLPQQRGVISLAERSPGDLSAESQAERSLSDLSALGMVWLDQYSNNITREPNHTTPNPLPIEFDQTDAPDPELVAVCTELGINGRALRLISRSSDIQARGPAYVRLHVKIATADKSRRGDPRGLAIHRMYRLLPALPCGDCGACADCRRYGLNSAESDAYADYADIIRR